VRSRYDLSFDVYAPDTVKVEELVRTRGWNSFYESVDERKHCCDVRKVQPLKRALAGASAWVTGMRREQSPTRSDLAVVERDLVQGSADPERPLWKLNPLATWTERQTWAFVEEHGVPTHALHRAGFPSIGCAPCTRAIAPGEDLRAGRWWWEDPSHKECGLHARRSA
jgi:phosphoadenosine phosphosulfate reductase